MTVNYYNSAGTDLDSLFLVTNGNDGGVGFFNASGQDLGNRYAGGSSLGYGVGLLNSAGTDLGYLRGKGTAPSISAVSVTSNLHSYLMNDGGIQNEDWEYYPVCTANGYFYFNYSCSGTAPHTLHLSVVVEASFAQLHGITRQVKFQYGTNASLPNWSQYSIGDAVDQDWQTTTAAYNIFNGACSTNPSGYIAWKVRLECQRNTAPSRNFTWWFHVKASCSNALGSSAQLNQSFRYK